MSFVLVHRLDSNLMPQKELGISFKTTMLKNDAYKKIKAIKN